MRLLRIVLIISLVSGVAMASPPQNYIQFLAGFTVLHGNKKLTPEQKAKQYRDLEGVTGVRGEEMARFIESYRNRPEELKKLYQSIRTEISAIDSIQ